ncbi:hypothetical protein V6N13_123107 [Hibiscus sabdariffa]
MPKYSSSSTITAVATAVSSLISTCRSIKMADCRNGEDFDTQHNEETSKAKYGGLVPKKKPLISKDHERAFFDSADWALCKVSLHL